MSDSLTDEGWLIMRSIHGMPENPTEELLASSEIVALTHQQVAELKVEHYTKLIAEFEPGSLSYKIALEQLNYYQGVLDENGEDTDG